MQRILNSFVQKLKNNRLITVLVVAAVVTALFSVSFFIRSGRVDARFENLATTNLYSNMPLISVGGVNVIKGNPNEVYTNISINAQAGSTIILEDVHIRQTTDKPFIICGAGYTQDTSVVNQYTIVVVGDCVIESTYKGAEQPLIQMESSEYKRVEFDPILNSVTTTWKSDNVLTITDEFTYEGVTSNYNGTLTLINAEETLSAVVGSASGEDVYNRKIPSTNTITYNYDYCGSGKVNIGGEVNLNIINRGFGAAIGGGGIVNGGTIPAASSEDVTITGGTTRIILDEKSFGNAIGGGSAITQSNSQYASSTTGLAGGGSDVVINGGSLYIETNGMGQDFGCGLGKVDSTVNRGTLTDGLGNNVCVYIANVDDDEANEPGGKFVNYDDVNQCYGIFDMEKIIGEEDYTYRVLAADYDNTGRTHIDTKSITTVDTEYLYSGTGYNQYVYDTNGNELPVKNIEGKLYFYVPSTEATFYNVYVDAGSKTHTSVTTYKDDEIITTARFGTTIKVEIVPEQDYEILNVYYMENGKSTQWPLQASGDGYYYFEMPSNDVTIYVIAKIPSYTITYMNDLGASHGNPTSYTVRDHIVLNNPSVPGMTFLGWEDEEGNAVTEIQPGSTGPIILYATWDEILYTVTFLDYDGTLIYTQATTYGGTVTPPADPVREHYTFTGWDKSFNYVTDNIVVRATYEENAADPVLPFNVNIDGSIVNGIVTSNVPTAFENEEVIISIKANVGYKLSKVSVIKDDGSQSNLEISQFQSIGGNQSDDGEYKYLFAMPASDVTVYVEFEKLTYTISYVNVGNNDHGNPTKYTAEDAFVLNSPTKDEYIFLGWQDADGNDITEIVKGTTGNLVLVGQWKPEKEYYAFRIYVNRGIKFGKVTCSHETADEGELITVSAEPDMGYRLKSIEYICANDLTSVSTVIENTSSQYNEVSFYMPAEDIIINAIFEEIRYNIVYVDVDESNNPSTYTYNDVFQFEIPVKHGYIFDKWYDTDGNQITGIKYGSTGNKVVIATWTKAPIVPSIYSVRVDDGIVNGNVLVDKDKAFEGDNITVTVKAEDGYKLDRLEFVADNAATPAVENGPIVRSVNVLQKISSLQGAGNLKLSADMVTDNTYIFTMPANNILVKAVFVQLEVNEEPTTEEVTTEEITTEEPTTEEITTEEPTTEEFTTEEETTTENLVGSGEPTTENDTKLDTGDENKTSPYILIAIFALLVMVGALVYKAEGKKEEYEL